MDPKHLSDVIYESCKKNSNKTAMRVKRKGIWEEISWGQLQEKIEAVARAVIDEGIAAQKTVGIFSQNKPEWTIADVGSVFARAVPVPIYPTNTAKQAEYIVNHAEIQLLFVGEQEQYDKAMEFIESSRFLKKLVVFDESVDISANPNAVYFSQFIASGAQSESDQELQNRLSAGNIDDLLTIIYTSGTTGEPKGVMIPQSNLLFSAKAHDARLPEVTSDDLSLSFLPLSHVFERIWTYYVLYKGATNVYLEDPKQIIDFIGEVKPTVMCAVPRFYEKIYAAIFDKLESASPVKRALFSWAVSVGRTYHCNIKDEKPLSFLLKLSYALADKLVLGKIREITGGRIRFFPCAGAPLSQTIEEFFYAVGVFVLYGYGMTETTATTTVHEIHHFRFGAVGKPLPGVEVKLDPANDEVLIKGPHIMKGYYKKPEETLAVFTEDGFLRSGDVGTFEENGELRITDRIKDLMKTSGGKYIAPQVIETLCGADHYIEQILVVADGRKFVSALVVPAFEALEEYARNSSIPYISRKDLVQHPDIISFYKKRIDSDSVDLAGFEKIKKFVLLDQEFTVEHGEMTPTLKLKRKNILDKYQDVIDGIYAG